MNTENKLLNELLEAVRAAAKDLPEITPMIAMNALERFDFFPKFRVYEIGFYKPDGSYTLYALSDNSEGGLTLESLEGKTSREILAAISASPEPLGSIACMAGMIAMIDAQLEADSRGLQHRYVMKPYLGGNKQLDDTNTIWGYLIDPTECSIQKVAFDGDYKSINKMIGADLFDHSRINDDGDSVYVDDNGLLVDPNPLGYFSINGRVYAGKGVIFGCDAQGNSVTPSFEFDTDNFNALEIEFLKREEINDQQIDPKITVTSFDSIQ